MSALVIKPVETRREQRLFLRLPWQLYCGDPHWIPPLRSNQRDLVGYGQHPFYRDADAQTFLAMKEGVPCGRIAAILNHAHNRHFNEQRGFFGFFESVNDPEVAAALFAAVRDWLAQRNIYTIRGPMNPSIHYEIGLLIEGFDSPPRFMMTYNPPYYAQLVEQAGFHKAQDLYAYWGHVEMLKTLDEKLQFVAEQATRQFQFQLRRFDRSRFREEVRTFLHLYNQASGAQWGFVPLSEAEVNHIGGMLRHLIVPEMTTVAEVDGQPVGAVFGLLDYNPRIKKIDGRLLPFGVLRLLWNRRAIRQIRIIAAEVLPQYQRWGLGLAMLHRLVPDILRWGIEEAEFSWVAESNNLSRKSLERGGAKRVKTYRIYDQTP